MAGRYARRDHDQTQVMSAVPPLRPPAVKEPRQDKTEVIPAVRQPTNPLLKSSPAPRCGPRPIPPVDDDALRGRHWISGEDDAGAQTAVIAAPQRPAEVEAEPETTRLPELAAFEAAAEPEAAPPVDDEDAEGVGIGFPVRMMPGSRPPSFRRRKAPVELAEAEPETTRLQELAAFEEDTEPEAALPRRRRRNRGVGGSGSGSRRRSRGNHRHPRTGGPSRADSARIRQRPVAAAPCLRGPTRTAAELGGRRPDGRPYGAGHRPRPWLDTSGCDAPGGRAVAGAGTAHRQSRRAAG